MSTIAKQPEAAEKPNTIEKQPEAVVQSGTSRARMTLDGDPGIHIEREFRASRKNVWRAMTKRKLIAKWWGRGNKLNVKELDFKPGGHWRFVEKTPESKDGFEGRFGDIQK